MTEVPPEHRPTSMVFQSYALFPYMNVASNVGYGLRLKKLSKLEISKRTDAMLELVGLRGFAARMPHELSGGQQQRMQLARSLVLERDILLLDEPLAAHAAQLRKEMCFELKRIQQEVGITFVHVTHNQAEAMTVADQVALTSAGKLIEEGTPRAMFEHPKRQFTADFIGDNNVFSGTVTETSSTNALLDIGHAQLSMSHQNISCLVGARAGASLRSEHLAVLPTDAPVPHASQQIMSGTFIKECYFGFTSTSVIRLPDGQDVTVRQLTSSERVQLEPGQTVNLTWRAENARLHLD